MRHGPICKRRRGRIALPFSDLSAAKKRPALVVATLTGQDIIVCQITSQAGADRYALSLLDADFADGGLRRTSNIRPNRIFTADSSIVLYRAGVLLPQKLQEVTTKIVTILNA